MERFESNLVRFYEDVKTIVPELFQESSPSQEKSENKDDSMCLEVTLPETSEGRLFFFVDNWYPHMEAVSSANLEHFVTKEIDPDLFPSLPFLKVMSGVNARNRDIIWEYLHTLFALSISTKEVKSKYGKIEKDEKEDDEAFATRKAHYETVQKTVENFPALVANMVSWKRERGDQKEQEPSQEVPPVDEKFLENSSLTKLAQEISQEINADEILNLESGIEDPSSLFKALLSGDESSGIGKLMRTVTDKLKTKMDSGEVNQDDLFRDANVLLQNMGRQAQSATGQTGGASGGGAPLPNLGNFMSMAQNLAAMGDLFGGAGFGGLGGMGAGGSRGGHGRRSKKKMKKRMKKMAEKRERERESKRHEESREQTTSDHRRRKNKNRHRRVKKKEPVSKAE